MARKKALANVNVKIAMAGGEVTTFNFQGEPTVEEALKRANIEYTDTQTVRVNSEVAELEDTLEDGDVVTVTAKIKGGSK